MYLLVCNAPQDRSRKMARVLVHERLAMSINILPNVLTFLFWKDRYVEDDEDILLIKVPEDRIEATQARVMELHPYNTAEVYAIEMDKLEPAFAAWKDAFMTVPPGEKVPEKPET